MLSIAFPDGLFFESSVPMCQEKIFAKLPGGTNDQ